MTQYNPRNAIRVRLDFSNTKRDEFCINCGTLIAFSEWSKNKGVCNRCK